MIAGSVRDHLIHSFAVGTGPRLAEIVAYAQNLRNTPAWAITGFGSRLPFPA